MNSRGYLSPELVDIGPTPMLVASAPNSDRHRQMLGPTRPLCGGNLPSSTKFARGATKFGPNSTNFDQHIPWIGEMWLGFVRLGPSSTEIGTESANFEQYRLEIDQTWLDVGQISSDFGRLSPEVG